VQLNGPIFLSPPSDVGPPRVLNTAHQGHLVLRLVETIGGRDKCSFQVDLCGSVVVVLGREAVATSGKVGE
jgi:hypothetical protein